jgi:hypothetical protein
VKLPRKTVARLQAVLLLVFVTISCGTLNRIINPHITDLCNCIPAAPDAVDYRHVAKHVPIPSGTPQEIDVNTILTWPSDPVLPPDQPRFGRELQLVHVALAYLENASVNPTDCDVHMEISQIPDKTAPRVVIETPVDSEYCSARRNIQAQLKQHGFTLDLNNGGELSQPLPVSVIGLPFEDFEHNRGSAQVATVWEIHPAIATIQ